MRALIEHLAHHPDDYRGALQRLRPELHGLYLSAYQSYLWNRLLASWLEREVPIEQLVRVPLRLGDVPMHRTLSEQQRHVLAALTLPLPTARSPLAADDPRKPLLDAVLSDEGLTLDQLKVHGIRTLFFSRGERAALCLPAALQYEAGTDDLHPARSKLQLSFDLPRGAYATLIIKRITASC